MKKNRLITSILTIALCVSLVAGATFALFTSNDEVNISVSAGKLQVYASLSDFQTYSMSVPTDKNGEFDNGGSADYADGLLVLTNVTPGDKVTFNVNIDNESNIFVKYRLTLTITNKVGKLSDTLVTIAELPNEGTTQLPASEAIVTKWADLAEGETTFPMSVELPALSNNSYQENEATINILVEAVQANHIREPQPVAPVAMTPDANGDYTVTEAGNLAWMAQVLADGTENFAGDVVTLVNDINVGGDILTPIGSGASPFRGTFDGNGKTVRNYLMTGTESVALIGNSYGTVKNVTVAEAEITGVHWVAGVVGYTYGNVINCHAVDLTITCIDDVVDADMDGDKVGAIVGYFAPGNYTLADNSATSCTIVANRDAGPIAGRVHSNNTLTNNTFSGVTITWSNFGTGKNLATAGDRYYGIMG